MNWKTALLLFVILFASAAITVAISLNTPKLGPLSLSETIDLDTGFELMGDPIDDPGPPH